MRANAIQSSPTGSGSLYREVSANEFELSGQFRVDPKVDAGIGFWNSGFDEEGVPTGGYEFQISGPESSPPGTGSLIGESVLFPVENTGTSPGEWTTFRLRVTGAGIRGFIEN